ncbi:FAD-dependent oxidoreductase [Mangrovicoccus algicola]|uniref:D-amino-acid oxidase n=1 Tax=Mangrovicoccus algicola TaxID=2771008 RepID=A0A8J7CIG9_9RHOB|nr:FAD-dependent oxidoreductase [Mangrovicoccus algicola]MBE3639540.1 FAD-dependent oxidoreductase [Mangrovicoccus algicola]
MRRDLISVLGAGVAGLCTATELAGRGHRVELIAPPGAPCPASHFAGGMLAPFCEGEAAPPEVVEAGQQAADWWAAHVPVTRRGTLVVAPPRDAPELDRFARATGGHEPADPGTLEPELAGRFARGLFYAEEAHLDPRDALRRLRAGLERRGVAIRDGAPQGRIVDCRGLGGRVPGLRAVRGEMLIVAAPEVTLGRPVRLLHPRFPCYIVPRADHLFMIGATMVERDDAGPVTARAAMELLSAAWTVHPGFAEARILELGAGLRPAFADNLPAVIRRDGALHVNGMYRHGFLMAPALARKAAEMIETEETIHAD